MAWYALFALLAAMCREDVAVYLIGWGLYVALVRKDYKVGVATATLSCACAAAAVCIMIPLFSPAGVQSSRLLTERYASYGTSVPTIVWGMLTHPLRLAFELLRRPTMLLLLSVLFLPLVSPSSVLLFGPPLAAARMSATSGMRGLRLYAAAPILPFLYAGVLAGLAKLCRHWPERRRRILWTVCIPVFLLNFGHWHWVRVTPRDKMVAPLVESIPSDASVKASYDLVPHLPRRSSRCLRQVFVVDGRESNDLLTDYVLIDSKSNSFPLDTAERDRLVAEYRVRPDYKVAREEDGLLILRREVPR